MKKQRINSILNILKSRKQFSLLAPYLQEFNFILLIGIFDLLFFKINLLDFIHSIYAYLFLKMQENLNEIYNTLGLCFNKGGTLT